MVVCFKYIGKSCFNFPCRTSWSFSYVFLQPPVTNLCPVIWCPMASKIFSCWQAICFLVAQFLLASYCFVMLPCYRFSKVYLFVIPRWLSILGMVLLILVFSGAQPPPHIHREYVPSNPANMETVDKMELIKKQFKNPPIVQMTYLLLFSAFLPMFLGWLALCWLQGGSRAHLVVKGSEAEIWKECDVYRRV